MSLQTRNDSDRNAQRSWDGRAECAPDDEAFQFACDQVAAELETEAETANVVSSLSGARHVVHFLMAQQIPAHLLPWARELADLVNNMSERVDSQMKTFAAGDMEDAA
ncbi:hypothetical protein [Lelliottia jeotgali]